MIWFPFYSSDFIGATVGLSCLERALLALMLPLYYEVGPFPADKVRVYRIVGCESDEQKRAVDFLLGQFFVLKEDGWYQERAEREKVKDAQRREQARAMANRRWHGAPHDAEAMPRHSAGNAEAMLPTPTPTPTSTEKMGRDYVSTSSESVDSDTDLAVAVSKKTAYKLPDCPYQSLVDAYHAALPQCPRVEVLSDQRKRHLQARWRQVCAESKLGRDAGVQWFVDFFQHVGKSAFLTGKVPPQAGRKPFFASLDWLMGAEKFVHVYEGRYHR